MEDELRWIRKVKAGETHFFQHLYQKHNKRLFSLCFRFTKNRMDAEEQLQEVFLKILIKIDQFREEASFSTWAYRLAVNHLINAQKKNQKPEDPTPVQEIAWESRPRPELAMILKEAVGSLPEGYRKVFVLHDQEGFNHEEIANILNCSPATSRSQLCRARIALREKLRRMPAKEAAQ